MHNLPMCYSHSDQTHNETSFWYIGCDNNDECVGALKDEGSLVLKKSLDINEIFKNFIKSKHFLKMWRELLALTKCWIGFLDFFI